MLRTVALLALLATTCLPLDAGEMKSHLRRPIALAGSLDGKWLYVANRESGTISIVDLLARSVSNEIDTGGRLTDLAVLDDTHLLALDEQHHQLLLLAGSGVSWSVVSRLELASYPVQLQLDRASKRCFVSSLWSCNLTAVELSAIDDEPHIRLSLLKILPLSFEPREMCLTMDGKQLIVAGSFTNVLGVVRTDNLELIAEKQISGHNIRGLAISGDGQRLLIAQQELNSIAQSTNDDVHWGNMISNLLVSFSLEDVCDPQVDIEQHRRVHYLGEPGRAAGDPAKIHVGPDGKLAILLAGVNEAGLLNDENDYLRRFSVGAGPSAIISTSDGSLCVANKFADTVSLIHVAETTTVDSISLGPQPELREAQCGEILFSDAHLSHDGWMSCQSCHPDGHSNGQSNDNLSDGSFGAPKRVLSLLGVGDTSPWAWNGHVQTLEDQVKNSIEKTMQGSAATDEQVAALTAYLKTLAPPPPLVATSGENEGLRRGLELFQSLDCQRCHTPPTYTSPMAYDVGLTDVLGNDTFNPPSLRGVARRNAFFHDARATSLQEVFATYHHQLKRDLSPYELDALLQYLSSL